MSVRRLAAGVALVGAMACGGGDPPTAPSPGGGGGGGGASSSATITIGANGVASPQNVTITQGGRVTFVNSDTRNRDMSSDPHPSHTDCPAEMSQVGFLTPGQSRTSGNFNTIRTCGYHDHNDPGNTGVQGRITVVQ